MSGPFTLEELFDSLRTLRPEPGDVVYLERRGDRYSWSRRGAGEPAAAPAGEAGFPDAWIFYSGNWPSFSPEGLQPFLEDLLAEMESMVGTRGERCRWPLDEPWPHPH